MFLGGSMPRKNNLTTYQIKTLFSVKEDFLIIKENDQFVDAYLRVTGGTNKNDIPFTKKQILEQPTLESFKFDGVNDFVYVCDLVAHPISNITNDDWTNEKIEAVNFTSDVSRSIFYQSMGVAYMLTCVIDDKEFIVKLGQTRTAFKQRLASYNCGVINNARTASTTNIKILQSFVAVNRPFKLYIFDCGNPVSYEWRGEKSVPFASPMPLAVEDIMLKKFIQQFGQKPLANVQTSATEINNLFG